MRYVAGVCSSIALLALSSGCRAPVSAEPEERQTFALQSVRTRYQARLNEGGIMPDNALMEAKAHRDTLLEAQREQDNAGIHPASWTWIGPGNIGGRLRSILIHPTQPSTMWVGSVGGGIWKTTNGGSSWIPLDDFMASIAIGCMALDPLDPDVLYAGTGEGFFEAVEGSSNTATMRGAGIFKSVDGGETWNQLHSTAAWKFVNRLAIHPTNSNIVWAATESGIYRSSDGGSTWVQKLAGDFLDLRMHPTDPTRLVANKSHAGVLFTSNEGNTWTQSTGIGGHRVELAYSESDPSTIYGAQCNNDRILIYRSTNGGQSFSLRTSGSGISMYAIYNVTLWVDPTNPNILIVGGVNLFRSTNAGTSFTQTFNSVHADMHLIVEHPAFDGSSNRTAFVACDGGIYRIGDTNGSSATGINNNLGVTQFYGAAVNDATGVVLAGAQDNGTSRYTGNALSWNENVIGGDGAYCASDPTNPQVWYGATQYQVIRRSTNGGSNFSTVAPPGAGSANNFNFIPYFMLDPNQSNRMYACGEFLWRSNNIRTGSPPSWSSIKPSIRTGGRSGGGGDSDPPHAHFQDNNPWNISTVAVAEGNADIIWVGHNNGSLYKTTNGLASTPTWTKMDNNPPVLPDRWISRIVIDRNDHNRTYVSFLGWATNNVWRTTDGGATWQQVTGSGAFSLPPAPVASFAAHRAKPGWLYAGTDIGIFTSSDDGATWTTGTDGPGTVPIDELVWRNDNVLMAVTHGRGIYFATIDPNIEPFSARSYSIAEGSLVGGQIQDTYISDDRYLTVNSSAQSQMAIEFEGVCPVPNPATIRLTVESRVQHAGGFQFIYFYNFTTNQWVQVKMEAAFTIDTTVVATGFGAGGVYVEPGTRRVRARLIHTASKQAPRLWPTHIDKLFWEGL